MKNNFRTNLSLKLISFVIAIFIWALVTNAIRPIVNDFINVPITITNEASIKKLNKAYVVKTPLISRISYKIDAERQSIIRQSDFKTYIDLNDLLTTNDLPIHYEIQNGVDKYISNIRIEPKTIHVVLDDAIKTEFPVQYDFTGKIDEGHSIGDVILSPNIIFASGGDELLKNISHVNVSIPVSDQDDNFTGVAKVHVIDKNGRELQNTGVEFSADEVNYSVSIFTRASVALNVKTSGKLPDDCEIKESIVTPNAIVIEGPRSIISNLYSIDLPPIDLTDAKENIEQIVPLKGVLPNGTRCQVAEAVRVKIEIKNNIIDGPTAVSKVVVPERSSEAEQNQ